MKYALLNIFLLCSMLAMGQTYNEILGRPTDSSITLSVLFDNQVNVYLEYGTTKGNYTGSTIPVTSTFGKPVEIIMSGLQPATRYYYRTRYKRTTESVYLASPEHTFITQRGKGSSFSFTIESDPHPYDKKCYQPLWDICLQNQAKDSADFMLDLGDTFGDDHQALTITNDQVKQLMLNLRPIFGKVCHSMPFFFCQGNHEGESGYYLLQTPPNNLATYETLWRKTYYPNPEPNGFYTGNNTEESFGMGKPQNYYAWEWGDALFVVLDAYRFYTANAKPRDWDWTIGKAQYDWLKQTLENSQARFKMVFIHHLLGEARGAAILANLNEWGGLDKDGTWKFNSQRPGWAMPIHQLLLANKVNILFQGHDHVYARETVDNLVYQTIPMPSDSSYTIGYTDNGKAFTGTIFKGSGHLRVTVNSDSLKVDYVSAVLPKDETASLKNGQVVYSYSAKSNVSSEVKNLSLNNQPKFSIFPNPATEEINLRFEQSIGSKTSVSLSGIDGRIRNKYDIGENAGDKPTVNFRLTDSRGNKLQPGVYFLSVQSPGMTLAPQLFIVK